MWPVMPGLPGYGYGHAEAKGRRRERDESSESRHRSKRKRDGGAEEKRDKKEKKEKKDRRDKDRGREDQVTIVSGGSRREAAAGRDAAAHERRRHHDSHAGDKHRGDPLGLGAGRDGSDRPRPQQSTESPLRKQSAPPSPQGQSAGNRSSGGNASGGKRWRQEVTDEDERDLSTDEDEREKKLEEARKRREALKAKFQSKQGEDEPEGASQPAPAAEGDGGGRTNGAQAPPAAAAEEAAPKGEEVEAGKSTRDEVNNFIIEAKKKEEAMGDMFDERKEAGDELKKAHRQSQAIGLTGASGDDWDDEEGYYCPKIGEVMGGRYLVVEPPCGRGVFSNVVKAKDQQDKEQGLVAIKMTRRNEMMTKAAEKEVEILETLNGNDKKDKKHIIRLLTTFAYRRHFCMVFECMADDLRATLKKYTKNKGMSLTAVRAYTQQLLVGLAHMHKCKFIHADIKPDNVLISKGHHVVKFCDLGTAVELKDITCSPYLASRFYRPPEVILGCEYGQPVDVWALGCTLYEIFTGKTLFQSKTNNDHLKKIMDLKGKIPGKVIKKGAVWKNHFTEDLDFKHEVDDPSSGQKVVKTITNLGATTSVKDLIIERVGPEKRQSTNTEDQQYIRRATQFADLLEQMLALDPDKRIRPEDALGHVFLQDGPPGKAAEAARLKAR